MNSPLLCLFLSCLSGSIQLLGQSAFINLSFEAANLPLVQPGQNGGTVSVDEALPGWVAYLGGQPTEFVLHNTFTLDSSAITVYGPVWRDSSDILEGDYSLFLRVGNPAIEVAIGQTGEVPIDARSLTYWSKPGSSFSLAFDGQALPSIRLGETDDYEIFGVDVSSLAGRIGELRFEGGFGGLDNIQFSTMVVPEPRVSVLLLGGLIFLGVNQARKLRSKP